MEDVESGKKGTTEKTKEHRTLLLIGKKNKFSSGGRRHIFGGQQKRDNKE